MAAYLGYTLRMKTLFHGWPVMVNDKLTRKRRSGNNNYYKYGFLLYSPCSDDAHDSVQMWVDKVLAMLHHQQPSCLLRQQPASKHHHYQPHQLPHQTITPVCLSLLMMFYVLRTFFECWPRSTLYMARWSAHFLISHFVWSSSSSSSSSSSLLLCFYCYFLWMLWHLLLSRHCGKLLRLSSWNFQNSWTTAVELWH